MKGLNRFVTLEWLILFVCVLGMAIYFTHNISDPDTPWHYAAGLYILSHHYVPTQDVFSWSSTGMPWVSHEWLFEVIFAWIGTHFGFSGVWLFRTIIMAITLVALYRLGVKVSDGNRVFSAALAVAGICGGAVFWTMRPQILSYMLFTVFLLALQCVREGKFKVLWLVPPLMLFWANVHASFVVGLLFLTLEVIISFIPSIGRFSKSVLPQGARWRLVTAAVVSAGVGFLNPNGIKAYTFSIFMGNPLNTNYITEWFSPNFHLPMYKYGVLPFLLVLCFLIAVRVRSVPIREVIFVAGCLVEFLVHLRFLPYFMISAVPLVAILTSDWLRNLNRQSMTIRIFSTIISVVWLGTFMLQLPVTDGAVIDHLSNAAYPAGAVNYMEKNHLTTRVLNYYSWGGYLIMRGVPTFVDGRTDPFLDNGIFADYLDIQYVKPKTPSLLDKYHFQAVLFPVSEPLVTYLTHTGGWKVVYSDNVADVLVPNQTP